MKPDELTLANLLATEGNQWHYHIPRFQREYIWNKQNWSKLVEDIYENDPGHYMGSVICVHDNSELSPVNELIYEVVDGQQRLTTISLLLAAIYSKLTAEAIGEDEDASKEDEYIIKINSIRQRLIKKLNFSGKQLPWGVFRSGKTTFCLRVQPSTQENNLEDYLYVLSEIGIIPEHPYPKNFGHRRIYRAYKFFRNLIPDDMAGLDDLLDRIYRLIFIHISETSQSKAFLLFETLNYRGVPLSAIDIIKNKMLATLESKHAVKINDSYDDWQDILRNLPEDSDQDRFLRQFYNAFKFDPRIKIDRVTRATRSNIIAIYENLIKRDAKNIFEQLMEKALTYNQLIESENYQTSSVTEPLINLERIGAVPSYTFLLYLFSLQEKQFAERDLLEKTVELLCKYYFRRNITDYPGTRDLDSINIDLVEQCQRHIADGEKLSFKLISKLILKGKGKPSSIKSLTELLSDNLYYNNDGMARYALTKLDEASQSKEYAPNLWARNEKGIYVWTVEHVFPQGNNIPEAWVDMVANGDKEKAKQIQADWVHCLGNLTLSGYNSRLSNQPFSKKQSKAVANVFGNKIHIGYKNGLALNNIEFKVRGKPTTLATAVVWNKEHIEARNTEMVKMLVELFKFDNE